MNAAGPEHAPLKEFIKTFKIKLTVFDKNDNLVREVKLDYGKIEDRKYIGKLSFWAWNEGYYVETIKDD